MLCSRVQNLLSAYCDRELTGAEMLHVRRHLDGCPACSRVHDELRHVKLLYGALAGIEPRRPFVPGILHAPPARRWRTAALVGERVIRSVELARAGQRRAEAALQGPRLLLAGGMVLAALCGAMLNQPQHPDAVAAHVPEWVEDAAEPVMEVALPAPDYYPTFVTRRQSRPAYFAPPAGSMLHPVRLEYPAPYWGGR